MQFGGFKMKTKRAGGANNGSNWNDAFTDLQDALATAVDGDELWGAAGVYQDKYLDEKLSYTYMVEACDNDGQRIGSSRPVTI